jgi:hypothetical protein
MSAEVAPPPEISAPTQEVEQTSHSRRLLAVGALALTATGLLGGAAEAAFTPTAIELGPHTATAQATLGRTINFDLGPLGNADKPSGWPLGVKVTVKGIPVPPGQSALKAASGVTAEYEQLFADPQHIESAAVNTVTTRIWHDAVEGGGLFGAAGLGGLLMTEPARRRRRQRRAEALATIDELGVDDQQKATLRDAIARPKPRPNSLRWSAAALGLTTLMACSGDIAHADPSQARNAPGLTSTLPGGFQAHGELLELLASEAIPRAEGVITDTEKFYDQVKANFNAAFTAKFGDSKLDHTGFTYVLSVSDNHCNIGMNRVHGALANAFKVDTVVDSGDMTMGGTAAEEECVAAEADALKAKGRDLLFAAGNHDSPTIEQKAVKHGFEDLHLDSIVTSHGIRYLGEDDVNESTFTVPMHLRGSETVEDETAAFTAAIKQKHPDVAVVHEPEMVEPAVNQGLVPLSISGHLHTWHAPRLLNKYTDSYQFIEGTSGGAKKNALTIGKLQQAAIDTVLVFDSETKRVVGYYVVTANTDASVTISDYTSIAPVLPNATIRLGN